MSKTVKPIFIKVKDYCGDNQILNLDTILSFKFDATYINLFQENGAIYCRLEDNPGLLDYLDSHMMDFTCESTECKIEVEESKKSSDKDAINW